MPEYFAEELNHANKLMREGKFQDALKITDEIIDAFVFLHFISSFVLGSCEWGRQIYLKRSQKKDIIF